MSDKAPERIENDTAPCGCPIIRNWGRNGYDQVIHRLGCSGEVYTQADLDKAVEDTWHSVEVALTRFGVNIRKEDLIRALEAAKADSFNTQREAKESRSKDRNGE